MGIKEAGWPVDLGTGESERVVWEHALARYSKTATASRIQVHSFKKRSLMEDTRAAVG